MTAPPTPFDTDPASALARIEEHSGPVVADFDETLFLTNSTTLFLSTVRPALVAYVIVKILDVLKPWRRQDGAGARDAWRVRALLTLMPWTGRQWRRAAAEQTQAWTNHQLLAALQQHDGPVVVATLGFKPIVGPLVDHMALDRAQLVAMAPSPAERRRGKFVPTAAAVEPAGLDQSLVVTDSPDDLDLLEAAQVPLRVLWPEARGVEAFQTVYFPTRYLSVVKRPGANYVRKIAKEDVALWVLGGVWLAANPLAALVGLGLLALSFWATYEYGYVDNDRIGDRHEASPRLSSAFRSGSMQVRWWQPAGWALAAGAAGLWALRWPSTPSWLDGLKWGGVLLATTGLFWLYNRIDKQSRVLLFPILQLLRLGSFLVLVPVTEVVGLALGLQVMARSVNYLIYRTRGQGWPDDDELSGLTFVVFVGTVFAVAASRGWSLLVEPTTISLVIWQAFLARHTLPAAVRLMHRIDR